MNVSYLLQLLIALYKFSEVLTAVSGAWGEWGEWSSCSVTCGYGTIKRYRNWEYPDGSVLNYTYIAILECWTEVPCPIHGGWGMWTAWSKCPVMCGGGTKTRTRLCNSPEPANEGNPCEEAGYEKVVCNVEDCPELPIDFDMTSCNSSKFMCQSELMCVELSERCDNKLHCDDGSDEKNCIKYLNWNNQGHVIAMPRLLVLLALLTLPVTRYLSNS